MNTLDLLHALLVIHLTGVILFIGTTLLDFVTLRQFWALYNQNPSSAKTLLLLTSRFPTVIGIGVLLIIVTAVGMMALTHGLFGEQLWLRIKFPIVVIAILNGILVGRKQGMKLKKAMESPDHHTTKIHVIKNRLRTFHIIQFVLFLSILILSVYKIA
jgi:hypothetical protein